jgi:hypothetical protein
MQAAAAMAAARRNNTNMKWPYERMRGSMTFSSLQLARSVGVV